LTNYFVVEVAVVVEFRRVETTVAVEVQAVLFSPLSILKQIKP
jgi:hypothetical protein